MMTYTRNTSIYCKYSKRKKFDYSYGITTITNIYRRLKRSRFLFFKSNLIHIYYYDVLYFNYISVFNVNIKNPILNRNNFSILKIIHFFTRISNTS